MSIQNDGTVFYLKSLWKFATFTANVSPYKWFGLVFWRLLYDREIISECLKVLFGVSCIFNEHQEFNLIRSICSLLWGVCAECGNTQVWMRGSGMSMSGGVTVSRIDPTNCYQRKPIPKLSLCVSQETSRHQSVQLSRKLEMVERNNICIVECLGFLVVFMFAHFLVCLMCLLFCYWEVWSVYSLWWLMLEMTTCDLCSSLDMDTYWILLLVRWLFYM